MGNVRTALGMLSGMAVLAGSLCGADVAAAQMAPSLGPQQISGKILSVDPKAKRLKVEAEKVAGTLSTSQPMEFALAETTMIIEGTRTLQPEDLRVGTTVKIEYTAEQDKHVAQSISVQAPGGGTRSPESATAPQESERRQSTAPPSKPSR